MSEANARHGRLDRVIELIELTAASFLAAVTALTFVSVFLRYIFVWSIPDSYDISSLLLGILIFWGIASANYRGEHITVDLLWSVAPPPVQRAMSVFADLVTLGAMLVFTWMMGTKVLSTRADHVLTFDLRQPVWIYFFIAWIGLAAAVLLLAVRTIHLLMAPARVEHQSVMKSVD